MKLLKKLTQLSGAVVRLTVGVSGAVLLYLALKDKMKRGTSRDLQK